ncbi:MAG: NADP-dependent oxidoreductase [Proteobacteria bacterium]|nr:NADP-dependent oxidoreductase [Pseudomonadota bacterium]
MKAAYIEKFGGPEVLTYGTLPDPVAGAGQVVVDAKTASVNGADPKVVLGDYKQTSFPLIIGRDFSGVVASVGEGVSDLKVGDEVFGVLETGRDGTYCEKIAVGASIIAKKPAGVSHVDAVAVALTGLTAICAVEEALKLKAGETILVQGGAGGVASFAIQLAKSLGARVISTTSTGNVDYVRGLGADEVIDYRKTDFRQVAKGIDAVFETVGGDVAIQSFEVLKPGGRAAFIASGAQAPKPERSDVTALRPAVPRTRAHLERVAALLASGAVKPPPVTLFPLADAQKALRVSAERHLRGKLILTMAG